MNIKQLATAILKNKILPTKIHKDMEHNQFTILIETKSPITLITYYYTNENERDKDWHHLEKKVFDMLPFNPYANILKPLKQIEYVNPDDNQLIESLQNLKKERKKFVD